MTVLRETRIHRFLIAPVRNLWRGLTSMRTALALLFLLAVAAIPGALLPQRNLNEGKTEAYIADHGWWGRFLDRIGMFNVFGSIWFTSIYVLLFISLVGCLIPRLLEHFRALRAKPVATPRNLSRLPRHETRTVDESPDDIAERVMAGLRGWRKDRREHEVNGAKVIEISAERGYTREFGNLVFHFGLLAILICIGVGKMYSYEGTRSLVADGEQMCTASTATFDSFRAGNLVDGTSMAQICLGVNGFEATFLPTGQPDMYTAQVQYQAGNDVATDNWKHTTIRVNHPLRVSGDRVYLLGNGFAPTFTVTFPNGAKRTQTVPFRPDDTSTMLSSGALRFDTPAGLYKTVDEQRKHQIAIQGVFAPTASFGGANGTLLGSQFPEPRDPRVAVQVYIGDTGLETGKPQNVWELDPQMIANQRLKPALSGRGVNLAVGQSARLSDGSSVRFDGYQRWISIQISHNPAQTPMLVSAIVMLAGLLVSLVIKRRRVWARITPAAATETSSDEGLRRTVVELGGLARTDQAGWGEGFGKLVDKLVGRSASGGH